MLLVSSSVIRCLESSKSLPLPGSVNASVVARLDWEKALVTFTGECKVESPGQEEAATQLLPVCLSRSQPRGFRRKEKMSSDVLQSIFVSFSDRPVELREAVVLRLVVAMRSQHVLERLKSRRRSTSSCFDAPTCARARTGCCRTSCRSRSCRRRRCSSSSLLLLLLLLLLL
jgi:hypothetical protein